MLTHLWLLLDLLSSCVRILGILSALHAVVRSRTPQGAISWGISLFAFPHLAVPLYWVFGQDRFKGYVSALQASNQRLKNSKAMEGFLSKMEAHRHDCDPERKLDLEAFERLAGIPFTSGNKITLLTNGDQTFSEIFQSIDSATEYVLVNFYILKDDSIGRQLKRHLIAKAEAGVRVYFIYDEFGSIALPGGYIRELRDAGVEMFPFATTRGRFNKLQVNFRNHRKAVVVDGKVGFVGGYNVDEKYLGRDPRIGPWRDTHLRIEGPAVQGVQFVFAEDFFWATGALPEHLFWQPQASVDGAHDAVYVSSGPSAELDGGVFLFLQSIHAAKSRLWFASPYFIPDPSVLEALKLAALRGVDVRIIIPKRTDILVCHLAAYSYFPELSGTGIRIYRYIPGQTHQKVCLIDDDIAWVGSSNMDNRSMRLNFEGDLVVIDREFAQDVESMLLKDLEQSRLCDLKEYDQKSLAFQATVQLARLFAPIL